MTVCELCGGAVAVGDWPFCGGDPARHVPARNFGDEPLESYIDENIDAEPQEITSRGQRRALMKQNHLEYRKKRFDLLPGRGVGRTYFDCGRR
jgi:hypothetical protein